MTKGTRTPLIGREAAMTIIEKQMDAGGYNKHWRENDRRFGDHKFHYGWCELKDLLDAIYGTKPSG